MGDVSICWGLRGAGLRAGGFSHLLLATLPSASGFSFCTAGLEMFLSAEAPIKIANTQQSCCSPEHALPQAARVELYFKNFLCVLSVAFTGESLGFFREWLSPSPEQHVTSANHLPPARGHEAFPGVSVVRSEQNMGMLQEKGTEKQSSAPARQEITEQDLEQLLADSDKLTPWESALHSWSRSA